MYCTDEYSTRRIKVSHMCTYLYNIISIMDRHIVTETKSIFELDLHGNNTPSGDYFKLLIYPQVAILIFGLTKNEKELLKKYYDFLCTCDSSLLWNEIDDFFTQKKMNLIFSWISEVLSFIGYFYSYSEIDIIKKEIIPLLNSESDKFIHPSILPQEFRSVVIEDEPLSDNDIKIGKYISKKEGVTDLIRYLNKCLEDYRFKEDEILDDLGKLLHLFSNNAKQYKEHEQYFSGWIWGIKRIFEKRPILFTNEYIKIKI